ncbi:EF-hand domain-containing protein [Noviherbaspirillum galbum]|uniref:EF-hand domain-containing protein n=1 Tax=Noviherbaspirillum galbum TaxID=2709383 RepID=A0A6B3SGN0_9BURK|nr:EF-hand domain-containing protein [Noviherbaspirillum galbum]NEX60024.1 EF-hand domain-containing protein [Noviherbaspirillum galbum]
MVSSIGSNTISAWSNALFSTLDTRKQGYIEQSDLQSAFDQIGSTTSSTASASGTQSTDVAALFKQLDGDTDGKVTQSELTKALTKVAEQLDGQFNQSRMERGMHGMHGGGHGGPGGLQGMPPPPPPSSSSSSSSSSDGTNAVDAAGFTKDELSAQLQETGSSDSRRSKLLNSLVNNFDKADTDGDGKISAKEAHSFAHAQKHAKAAGSDGTAAATTGDDQQARVAMQLLKLLQAYGNNSATTGSVASTDSGSSASVSVLA